MDCKEFERLIPEFLDGRLDFVTLEDFVDHYKSCGECNEELVIKYLVFEGIQRLEEGDTFYLQKELDQCIQNAEKKIQFHKQFIKAGRIMEVILLVCVALFLIWIVI